MDPRFYSIEMNIMVYAFIADTYGVLFPDIKETLAALADEENA